ncbi:phosphoribosylanthranilate isomerase, partial [Lactococcus lactis]
EQSLKIYEAAKRDEWRGGKQKDSFIFDELIKERKRNDNE